MSTALNAKINVGVFITSHLDGEKSLLLMHRTVEQVWELPGGRVHEKETPWMTAARIIQEKAGIMLVGHTPEILRVYARVMSNCAPFLYIVYKLEIDKPSMLIVPRSKLHDVKAWAPMSKLPQMKVEESVSDLVNNPRPMLTEQPYVGLSGHSDGFYAKLKKHHKTKKC